MRNYFLPLLELTSIFNVELQRFSIKYAVGILSAMGFKIVIADGNANFMSKLGRALLNSDYALYPAESKETALNQISNNDVDACIIDVDLPGGIEEVLQACMDKSKPIIAMGISPLKETEKLVEIMYYGIPYVKKFNAEGEAKLDHIIARMNVLLRTLLIFSKDSEYQRGVIAGLESKGYKVFTTDSSEDLMHTFLLSEPKAVLVYFPNSEDLEELAKIRKFDSQLPIAVVLNNPDEDAGDLLGNKSTRALTQGEVSDYLDNL
jgi:DNA-binding response OmpR family regulator